MTLKRIIYRTIIRLFEKLMMWHSFKNCQSINLSIEQLPSENTTCDIITIAFNNLQTIEWQIPLIRKHIQGDYNYIVADNSSNKTIQKEIEKLCKKNNVSYVRLPTNYFTTIIGYASYSHGASLNWMYYQVIKKRQPCYFGFIDHDLFPIKMIYPAQKLEKQPIYGILSLDEDIWQLWSGLCFYRFDFVKNLRMDFLPAKFKEISLDSGGGNWASIYSKMDRKLLSFESQKIENIGEENDQNNWFENSVVYMGDCWIHTVSASNWRKISPEKMKQKELMLKEKIAKI